MGLPKGCGAFVPNRNLDDAYLSLSRDGNYEIQQQDVNGEKLKALAISLSKLFGYCEPRLINAIKEQNKNNLGFLH